MLTRRSFLASSAASLLTAAVRAAEVPTDLRVTRLTGFNVISKRAKVAGKNARLDVHGDRGTDRMLRIETNVGVTGIGNCGVKEDAARLMLGKHPLPAWDRNAPTTRLESPLGAGTMPLWDLLGKLQQQPLHVLFGGRGPERVPVYDGSIYFADLLPEYADTWEARFREEIDQGIARGHRAFKVKLGRGSKWMDRAAGDARDIAVLKVIREHAGPDIIIGVDANNGYDLAGTKRLFESIADLNIAFAEEMFEETVEECLAFQSFLREQGLSTLVADGETQGDLDFFLPFIEKKAIEVYQADMNRFGFDGILKEAAWCEPQGLTVAPHNWGSLVGFWMQLHVGRAIPNLYLAEHDPLTTDVLVAEGVTIADGHATLSDAPGAGVAIHEPSFEKEAEIRFDIKA